MTDTTLPRPIEPGEIRVAGISPSAIRRFWSRVDVRGPNECWQFQGYLDKDGYGIIMVDPIKSRRAHRISYVMANGPIPDELFLDHLCRVRCCVNPNHLEPVTPRENVMRSPIAWAATQARQTHCKRGHEFNDENTRIRPDGSRHCRTCELERNRRRAEQRSARYFARIASYTPDELEAYRARKREATARYQAKLRARDLAERGQANG